MAWEGSLEDRKEEEEMEASGDPEERQAGGWTESLQALGGGGVTLVAAVTPPWKEGLRGLRSPGPNNFSQVRAKVSCVCPWRPMWACADGAARVPVVSCV